MRSKRACAKVPCSPESIIDVPPASLTRSRVPPKPELRPLATHREADAIVLRPNSTERMLRKSAF